MLAWIGNVLIVIGLWKVGDKWRHAFLFSIAGELAYIARSVAVGDWALATICVVFCAMAALNWVKWGRAEEPRPVAIIQCDQPVTDGTKAAIRDAVTSGREIQGPRPVRRCGGPPLCRDQWCNLEDGHA